MHKLYELREMLMEELEKCTKKGELSVGGLDIVDKLTHSIKSIDTILAMEESGYSSDYAGRSYARGGRSSRGGNSREYARNAYGESYRGESYRGGSNRSYRGYSRDEAKEELVSQLRDIAMGTQDGESREMIERWISQVEQR